MTDIEDPDETALMLECEREAVKSTDEQQLAGVHPAIKKGIEKAHEKVKLALKGKLSGFEEKLEPKPNRCGCACSPTTSLICTAVFWILFLPVMFTGMFVASALLAHHHSEEGFMEHDPYTFDWIRVIAAELVAVYFVVIFCAIACAIEKIFQCCSVGAIGALIASVKHHYARAVGRVGVFRISPPTRNQPTGLLALM